ncbi:MAG: hypothetical protein BMS9Abin37_2691 [Acidobacteriota bacterium]|nr:MAG: hypothetical protein BMS9Abin37_2691 [Acidobacteriota bacterium]
MDGLIEAMTSSLDSIRHYYHRDSGEVVTLSDEFGTGQLEGPAERYQLITPLSVSERFQIMEDFVETLKNDALEDELNQVLTEKGAFVKFDEALTRYPTRNKQWERFRSDRVASRARAWLQEHGLG